MHKKLYPQIIDALVDKGYIVIKNALEKELVSGLITELKDEKDFTRAGISGAGDLHLDSTKRRDKIHWLDGKTIFQDRYLNFTDTLKEHLNRELFLGLKYYESHFAIYDRGDFYEKHLDAFRNSKNRVVTTVFFLNENWGKSDGGELIVYDKNDNILAQITPELNTLVVFMSEVFPHEVKPTNRKRYSIAGWFRVDRF
ncbi:MAG: 2OG-Fe(II) oxygenase [Sulfurimonas sp.]|nr:2OG-Fe(II) oxygenase [Sulfurimonas sp.]